MNQFIAAKRLLFSFLDSYAFFYDKTVIVPNAHQAYHIPDCVQRSVTIIVFRFLLFHFIIPNYFSFHFSFLLIFRNGPLRLYACDYYETILGFYSRTVKATKLGVFSYCYAAQANEMLNQFPTTPSNWVAISETTSVLLDFKRGQKLYSAGEYTLKHLWIKSNGKPIFLKPFSRKSRRDSSAISYLDENRDCTCGRVLKIICREDMNDSISFNIEIVTYQRIPNEGFPKYFQIFSLHDSIVTNISLTNIQGSLLLFDSPLFPKINGKEVVIATNTLFRLS